jgi:hypothetical protein
MEQSVLSKQMTLSVVLTLTLWEQEAQSVPLSSFLLQIVEAIELKALFLFTALIPIVSILQSLS